MCMFLANVLLPLPNFVVFFFTYPMWPCRQGRAAMVISGRVLGFYGVVGVALSLGVNSLWLKCYSSFRRASVGIKCQGTMGAAGRKLASVINLPLYATHALTWVPSGGSWWRVESSSAWTCGWWGLKLLLKSNRITQIEFTANEICFIIRPFTTLCCCCRPRCLSNYLPTCLYG